MRTQTFATFAANRFQRQRQQYLFAQRVFEQQPLALVIPDFGLGVGDRKFFVPRTGTRQVRVVPFDLAPTQWVSPWSPVARIRLHCPAGGGCLTPCAPLTIVRDKGGGSTDEAERVAENWDRTVGGMADILLDFLGLGLSGRACQRPPPGGRGYHGSVDHRPNSGDVGVRLRNSVDRGRISRKMTEENLEIC